jgi:hypothetical protein
MKILTIVICTAGALFACTSAGNDPAIDDAGPEGGADAGRDTDDAAADAEGGADAGRDTDDAAAETACAPSPVDVATVDAGALWGCYQTACASELSGCAADCVCNATVMSGLQCLLDGAGSADSCFYPPILSNASNVQVRAAGTCLARVLMDGGCERSAGGQPEGGSGGESGAPAGD